MNRFVKTALAIVAAGSVANAGTGDNEWLELDSAINGLSSSLKPSQDGMGWSALIRAVYTHSSDDIATGLNGPDVSGFNFNDVDLAFWGNQGPYMWRISADISDSTGSLFTGIGGNEGGDNAAAFVLEDAYVKWNCGGYFDAMIGNFKPHASRSNSVDPEKMLFIDRSAVGSVLDSWDNGIGASGTWEQAAWYVAITNGFGPSGGGHTRDHLYVLRGEWNLGSGVGLSDGAVGSSDTLNATAGVTFINDDSQATTGGDSDHDMWLVDFHGNVSQLGFGAEVAVLNDDFGPVSTDEDFSNLNANLVLEGDSKPWNLYASYLINPEWEVGVRYEDLDNNETSAGAARADNTLLSVAANWYRNGGAGKWQAQWTDVSADSGFDDGSIIEVGYVIGASR
jgi:hypothetical protein